jgi:hypothetical protein
VVGDLLFGLALDVIGHAAKVSKGGQKQKDGVALHHPYPWCPLGHHGCGCEEMVCIFLRSCKKKDGLHMGHTASYRMGKWDGWGGGVEERHLELTA